MRGSMTPAPSLFRRVNDVEAKEIRWLRLTRANMPRSILSVDSNCTGVIEIVNLGCIWVTI